jgi:hypothetical protein
VVTSWADFERAAPDLAAVGRRLLPEVAFLATVSRAGRPRVHPMCPAIVDGRLWAFIMDSSPKRHDLDRSGEYAMHALPGAEDEQFFVAGRAALVEATALRAAVLAAMPYDDADATHLLYEFDVDRVLWTRWENFQRPGMRPVHQRWTGKRTRRRSA